MPGACSPQRMLCRCCSRNKRRERVRTATTMFDAVEKLGLRFENKKLPLPAIVIDHIEKPDHAKALSRGEDLRLLAVEVVEAAVHGAGIP